MNYRILTTTALAAALVAGQVGRASADIGEVIVGGIIGGVVAGAINEQRNQSRPRTHTRTVVVDSAARQLARDVQRALNYFHWNVGAADGVLGRNSRAGIRAYQGYLGFDVSGHLSDAQRRILLTSHQRAELGGAQVTRVAAQHRDGIRGILEVVRDEALGVQPVAAAQPQAPTAQVPAETPVATVPNLLAGRGAAAAQVSLASHCNRVSLVTSANGGYTDMQSMADPVFALNEQFCLARGYAIAEGETLVSQIAGATPQGIAQQCAGMEPLLQSHVAALSLQPRNAVLGGVTQFVRDSGMSADDLAGTARICLSSGYQTDNLTIAIGSALVLVALGETAYGELPAHHLMQGIGASQRRDLAAEWFHASLSTDPAATTEVAFSPGPEDRNALIAAAVTMAVSGGAAQTVPATLPMPNPQPAAPSK